MSCIGDSIGDSIATLWRSTIVDLHNVAIESPIESPIQQDLLTEYVSYFSSEEIEPSEELYSIISSNRATVLLVCRNIGLSQDVGIRITETDSCGGTIVTRPTANFATKRIKGMPNHQRTIGDSIESKKYPLPNYATTTGS
jgi:hypothetical protein